ncbi:MAG: hypothetical protein KOO62_05095, partial [candidate division Zixibacteria bacterium]|nr:hypothetical protein [candidate division Zixibacteria bacterium]
PPGIAWFLAGALRAPALHDFRITGDACQTGLSMPPELLDIYSDDKFRVILNKKKGDSCESPFIISGFLCPAATSSRWNDRMILSACS